MSFQGKTSATWSLTWCSSCFDLPCLVLSCVAFRFDLKGGTQWPTSDPLWVVKITFLYNSIVFYYSVGLLLHHPTPTLYCLASELLYYFITLLPGSLTTSLQYWSAPLLLYRPTALPLCYFATVLLSFSRSLMTPYSSLACLTWRYVIRWANVVRCSLLLGSPDNISCISSLLLGSFHDKACSPCIRFEAHSLNLPRLVLPCLALKFKLGDMAYVGQKLATVSAFTLWPFALSQFHLLLFRLSPIHHFSFLPPFFHCSSFHRFGFHLFSPFYVQNTASSTWSLVWRSTCSVLVRLVLLCISDLLMLLSSTWRYNID